MIGNEGVRFLANQDSNSISTRIFVNNITLAGVSINKEMEVIVDTHQEGILLIEIEVVHLCQNEAAHTMRYRQSFNIMQDHTPGGVIGILKGGT